MSTETSSDLSHGIMAGFSIVATTFFSFFLWRFVRNLLYSSRSASRSHDIATLTDPFTELRSLRESGIRDSARVLDLWHLIQPRFRQLGIEKWAIVEQVFIAALDMADDRLAHDCLNILRAQFKKSSRVTRLFGMYLERNGRFDDARAIYTQLLAEDATNIFARKRMVAILKAQHKTVEAVDELRQYLKIFMNDFEAWNELCDLYLSEGDYKHAAFCMEELILSNPHNHLYCQRYAEIKYTEGGTENLEVARTYYSRACQLNPNNLRSHYGLLLTCSALESQSNKSTWDPVTVLRLTSNLGTKTNQLMAKSTKSNCELLPPFTTGTLSNSELNRQLVRWATNRIHSIYETAFVSSNQSMQRGSSILMPNKKLAGPLNDSPVAKLHSSLPNCTD